MTLLAPRLAATPPRWLGELRRADVARQAAKLPRRIAARLAAGVLAGVSAVVPRRPDLWAFGSWYGTRFADNPKHLFLHCATRGATDVQAVWLSADAAIVRRIRALGLRAYHRASPTGVWYALRAGVYLFDCRVADVSPVAGRGALKVNLWHGVPLKRIERDIQQVDHPLVRARRGSVAWRVVNRLLRPQLTEAYDLVLGTSPETDRRFASAFGLPPDRVIGAGYPRNDAMLAGGTDARFLLPEERAVAAELCAHRAAGRRVLVYMPTFRDVRNTADRRIPLDWARLNTVLAAGGGVLYCKLHSSDHAVLPPLDACPSIRQLHHTADMHQLLGHADALITDYSSIFFDFLLLDRPLLFFPYDLADYQRACRSLYDEYESVTPGPHAVDSAALVTAIEALLRDFPGESARHADARGRVRRRFFAEVDGAAERTFSAVRAAAARRR